MTPIFWALTLVLTLSCILVWASSRLRSPHHETNLRFCFSAHGVAVACVSALALAQSLGVASDLIPGVFASPAHRLHHSGFYAGGAERVVFGGDPSKVDFYLPQLGPLASITLKRFMNDRPLDLQWRLNADVGTGVPLRLDGEMLNLPASNWLDDGEQLLIENRRHGSFLSITCERRRSWWLPALDRYFYQQGSLSKVGEEDDLVAPLLVSERTLLEGYSLADLVGDVLTKLEEQGGDLALGVDFAGFQERHATMVPLLRLLRLYRRQLGDVASQLGVEIAATSALPAGARVRVLGPSGSSRDLVAGRVRIRDRLLSAGSLLRVGLGEQGAVTLRPAARATNSPFGPVANIALSPSPSWPYPQELDKELFILSRAERLPLDGFLLDLGLMQQPFYAKVQYLGEEGGFRIVDGSPGRSAESRWATAKSGDEIHLGNLQRGAVFTIQEVRSPIRHAGHWALGALLVGTVLVVRAWRKEAPRANRIEIDLAWCLLWGFVVTLLVVRVILAYRVATGPPEGASLLLTERVFVRSLSLSLWALLLIPSLFAISRSLCRVRRRSGKAPSGGGGAFSLQRLASSLHSEGILPPLLAIAVLITLVGWLVANLLLGGSEQFLGARVNLVTHCLIAVGLAASASWLERAKPLGQVILLTLLFALPTAALLLIGDSGFLLHLPMLAFVALLLFVWQRQWLAKTVWSLLFLGVGLLAIPLLMPQVLSSTFLRPWVERILDPATDDTYYRATAHDGDNLLLREESETAYNFDLWLRNSQQRWSMLHYAAEGVAEPKGYGGAPFPPAGMTYPTSLTDTVFATQVLAEHGPGAGLLLICLYLGIAFALLYGAVSLPGEEKSRLLPLILVAGFFSFNALYMVGANLGSLLFTGQNLPLLALYSCSDVVATGSLLVLCSLLLTWGIHSSSPEGLTHQPVCRMLAQGMVAASCLGLVFIVYNMISIARQPQLRERYALPSKAVEQYRSNLQTNLHLDPKTLELEIRGPISWVEHHFAEAFQKAPSKEEADTGIYVAKERGGRRVLDLEPNTFNLGSPFRPDAWTGTIKAHGEPLNSLAMLGKDRVVFFGDQDCTSSVSLRQPEQAGAVACEKVVLVWEDLRGSGRKPAQLIELKKSDEGLHLQSYGPDGSSFTWRAYVDGEAAPVGSDRVLRQGQFLRVEGSRPGGERFAETFLYMGKKPPVLAFPRWLNGKLRRDALPCSFAQPALQLTAALDQAHRGGADEVPRELVLSLDFVLEMDLEALLRKHARLTYSEQSVEDNSLGMAITVMNAHSGEVLALPYWLPDEPPSGRHGPSYPPRNLNFRNHPVASTIKPLLFSAVATGFQAAGFDLSQLSLEPGRGDCEHGELDRDGDACTVLGLNVEKFPNCSFPARGGVVSSASFLTHSNNHYARLIGLLGMMTDPNDWRSVLHGSGASTPVRYRGEAACASMMLPTTVRSGLRPGNAAPLAVALDGAKNSIFFKQMAGLFGATLSLNLEEHYDAWLQGSLVEFYSFLGGVPLPQVRRLEDSLPSLINLEPALLQTTADLLPIFNGARTCGSWNNVRMAEAMARLVTGRRARARLGPPLTEAHRSSAEQGFEPMPPPLDDDDWRRTALVDPLRQVGVTGTAKELAQVVADLESSGFRLLLKTGTIGPDGGKYESEMLMFVLGRWVDESFVNGQTLAGFFHLENSAPKGDTSGQADSRESARIALARELFPLLRAYILASIEKRGDVG